MIKPNKVMKSRLCIVILPFVYNSINFMINDVQVHQNSIILHDLKITKSFLGVYRMS
nr:hypothetical protein KUHPSE09_04950 [Staphylococcus epidermidis]